MNSCVNGAEDIRTRDHYNPCLMDDDEYSMYSANRQGPVLIHFDAPCYFLASSTIIKNCTTAAIRAPPVSSTGDSVIDRFTLKTIQWDKLAVRDDEIADQLAQLIFQSSLTLCVL